MPYGKYKQKKIADVAKLDMPYLRWISSQAWCKDQKNVHAAIMKHLSNNSNHPQALNNSGTIQDLNNSIAVVR
jgi:uncharacterized protein (DUF3820 family)